MLENIHRLKKSQIGIHNFIQMYSKSCSISVDRSFTWKNNMISF